jgi:hypothetical protein
LTRAVCLALAALLIPVGGCGSGSDQTTSTAASPDQDVYVERVDRICAEWATRVTRTSQRFEATAARAGAAGALAATADRYRRLAAQLDRLVERVRAVAPPQADAGTLDAWLAATSSRAAAQRELADALAAQPVDAAAVAALKDRLQQDAARADAEIRQFGADRCAPRSSLDPGGPG